MTDNIIPLGNITKLDIPVDRVCDDAKKELKSCIIIGYDNEGEFYASSTIADGGEVIWLLEKTKQLLLEE